ncbi:hypothetical protein CASFOL_014966 [Castilleja foliolosa]|uniref:Thioredoxin domain-containing protein n=1 Tax=Castilleja foliolosa TaxID=1961234 RepID=A0ABD3DCS6_9LAMI
MVDIIGRTTNRPVKMRRRPGIGVLQNAVPARFADSDSDSNLAADFKKAQKEKLLHWIFKFVPRKKIGMLLFCFVSLAVFMWVLIVSKGEDARESIIPSINIVSSNTLSDYNIINPNINSSAHFRTHLDWKANGVMHPWRNSVTHDAEIESVLEKLRQVIEIRSFIELKVKLRATEKASGLAVLYFTATWCGPCRYIGQVISDFAEKYPKVVFLKVDIDEAPFVAAEYKPTLLPSFFFVRNGREIDNYLGVDMDLLEAKLAQNERLE